MTAPELREGFEIPELVKHATLRQLVQYAGASGDFYEMHYDPEFARARGLPGIILHGLLKAGFLAQLVTDWASGWGRLKTFEVSYRGMDLVGRPVRCRGVITAVRPKEVDLDVWSEDPEGNKTTIGRVTVYYISGGLATD
jgi:acyl dehydratase